MRKVKIDNLRTPNQGRFANHTLRSGSSSPLWFAACLFCNFTSSEGGTSASEYTSYIPPSYFERKKMIIKGEFKINNGELDLTDEQVKQIVEQAGTKEHPRRHGDFGYEPDGEPVGCGRNGPFGKILRIGGEFVGTDYSFDENEPNRIFHTFAFNAFDLLKDIKEAEDEDFGAYIFDQHCTSDQLRKFAARCLKRAMKMEAEK